MADLGNLYFDILLRDMTDADIDKIKKKLEKVGVKIGADVDRKTFEANIKAALKNKTFDVDLSVGKNIKKAAIEANKSILTQSVTDALKGKTFSADLKLVVKNATVQDAIRQAFAQAGMQYNTTASDVRAQRILEIQQRMAIRAANAQRNLGNSYRYSASGAHESARASVVLGRSLHANIRLAGELGTALGNFASVFGVKDLLQDIVRIGGQLENQRIALGAILQDGGKATEMFSRIQSLAVKSPFGIMDLNQYTKQLSAYSIPYNELYETMKRLADISAGVGVDMGRIVLAFGQVRAAGFLKGTELRQFTEANIPMVDKLAERFSNLEKRIVSAGEVYDMISKKKVTFEDVKSVLWDLTGEGGMFNNMQEVLSESLASKWKNLADAIDVMYGKIADGGIGSGLKSLAEILTELTKNWEYVATAIGTATGAYLAYKLAISTGVGGAANGIYKTIVANQQLETSNARIAKSYRQLTAAEQGALASKTAFTTAELRQAAVSGALTKEMTLRLIAMGKISVAQAGHLKQVLGITRAEIAAANATSAWSVRLAVIKNAFIGVGTALKSLFLSPWTWVFAGVTAITELLTHYSKKQDEIKQRNDEFLQSAKGSAETLERELVKIKDLDIVKLNTDEMKVKVKEFTTIIQNEADGWQSILSEIFAKEADGTFKNSVEEQLKLLKVKMEELAEAKKKLMGDDESYSDVIGSTETGALWWEKDIVDRVKAYSEAVEENDKRLKELAIHARDVSTAIGLATSGNKELSKSLEGRNLNDQVAMLKDYEPEWKKFIVELTKSNSDAAQIVNEWYNNIEKYFVKGKEGEMLWDFSLAKEAMINSLTLHGEDINNLSEGGRQYVLGFVARLIAEAAVQKQKVQQFVYDRFTEMFGLPRNDLNYIVPPQITTIGSGGAGGSKKDAVAEMWKKRAAEIEKAVKMYDQWKKVEGKDKALQRVSSKDELANLFNGAYGFNLNLENPEKAYEYIMSKLNPNKEKQKELLVNLGVKLDDATLNDAQSKLKDYLEKTKTLVNRITDGWDLYDELFKATGNQELSSKIAFGGNVSFKNRLGQLKSEIEKEMVNSKVGISFDELVGLNNEELNQRGLAKFKNLIEAYNKENKKLKDESVRNFIEILNSSRDFAQQIADIERELQKDLADLRSNAKGMSAEELKRRENELIRKAEEDKAKVQFEEFKKSSDWVKVFDDLDRVSNDTLDNMILQVEAFATKTNLGVKETKELVEALRKLREESVERNPFEGFSDAWGRLKNLKDALKRGKMEDGLFYVKQSNGMYKGMTEKEVKDGTTDTNKDLEKSTLAIVGKFDAVAKAADFLGGVLGNTGNELQSFASILSGMVGGAQTGAGIAGALGYAGPWGAIAGAAIGLISSSLAAQDKKLQAQIEAIEAREKALSNLSKNLENALNNMMGGIFQFSLDEETRKDLEGIITATDLVRKKGSKGNEIVNRYSDETIKKAKEAISSDSYFDAQWALLMAQRDDVRKKLANEEQKDKDKSESKIEDYNQELKELELNVESFAEDMVDALYGIDFKDWASQLTDSIVDAWASGEDAAKAYENTVSDIMRNVAAKMAQQAIIEKYMNDFLKPFLDKFTAKNGVMDNEMYSELANIVDGTGERVEQVQQFLEELEKVMNEKGLTLKDTTESSSSGLSKDVEGVTEDTANLLGSYLNSIRHDSSVKRTLIEKLIGEDIPRMSYIAEAQLRELNQIVANTKRNADVATEIRDLFNRVVDKGSNKLKV